jgi:hypothetical protein
MNREKISGGERVTIKPFTAAGKSHLEIQADVFKLEGSESVRTQIRFHGTPISETLNAAEAQAFIHHFTAVASEAKAIAEKLRAKKKPGKSPAKKKG